MLFLALLFSFQMIGNAATATRTRIYPGNTYKSWDFDRDNKKDTLKITRSSYGEDCVVTIKINKLTFSTKKDYRWPERFEVIRLANSSTMIYMQTNYNDSIDGHFYMIKKGKIVEPFKTSNFFVKGLQWRLLKVSGNEYTLRITQTNYSLGSIWSDVKVKYTHGKFSVTQRTSAVHKGSGNYNMSWGTLRANRNITLYTDGHCKTKVGTIAKGKTATPLKIYRGRYKEYIQMKLPNGKTGWYVASTEAQYRARRVFDYTGVFVSN